MILLSNPPFFDFAKPKFQHVETYVESDGNWNQTLEIDANTPFVLVISVKDNWEVESVKVSAGKAALNSQTLIKLEGDNEYNIEGNSWYYHFFENGLDTDAYSFIFYAEDAEGNSNSKSISLTIG